MSTEVLPMLVGTNKGQTVLYYDAFENACQHSICAITMSPNIFKKSFLQGWNVENLGAFHALIHPAGQDHSFLEVKDKGIRVDLDRMTVCVRLLILTKFGIIKIYNHFEFLFSKRGLEMP
jgi:hypothetical protein